jgi:hypothetical protein
VALLGLFFELGSCKLRNGDSAIVINEFLAANATGIIDVDGETSDWIELHNRGDTPVDLEGWRLTDNPHEPNRWRFPAVSLPAKAYLLVFASGKLGTSAPGQLHTSFRLKASQDYLGLLRPGGDIAHEFAPYPEQKEDVSFGLTSTGAHDYLSHPTPEMPNSEGRPRR